MRGFFTGSELRSLEVSTASALPKCGACGLYKTCRSPKMKPFGKGRKGILVVGEAPGATEDAEGRPFIGKAGEFLRTHLEIAGIDLDRDCITTNTLICRPPGNKIPRPQMVDYCRPNLLATIKEMRPKSVLLLGATAIRGVIGHLWRHDVGKMGLWTGWQIPDQQLNAWIVPTFHPAFLLRMSSGMLDEAFDRHLEGLTKLTDRPWNPVPEWTRHIQLVTDDREAERLIRLVMSRPKGPAAWDFETNCLKPEYPGARILSASICQGPKLTFAFPWHGRAVAAMKEFVRSEVPKIASNLKFEERWTKRHLGCRVRNWYWDTMLAAHVLDCRPGITGLKFQTYVQLGVGAYNDHLEEFLEVGANGRLNEAAEQISLDHLLRYNAEDSLYEYLLAKRQWELFGGTSLGTK